MRLSRSQILVHTGLDPHYIRRKIRRAVLERDGHRCRFCREETNCVCHDLPLCRGGKTRVDNLLTCCRLCSRDKQEATAKEFEFLLKSRHRGSRDDGVQVSKAGAGARLDLYLIAEVNQFLQRVVTSKNLPLKVRAKAERLSWKLTEDHRDKTKQRKIESPW